MICKECELISFRNIDNIKIELCDGVNVIYGENAQGKTNILEGIYIFARGKSFRAFKDREMIKFGKEIAYSKIKAERKEGELLLGVEISKNQNKKFFRNNQRVNKTSEIIGEFRAVLFCPSHLGIIKDAPSVRRKFLDVAISQLRPVYIKMLSDYQNILESRNAILKMNDYERQNYMEMLDIYSKQLSYTCADIAKIRLEYVKKLDYWVSLFIDEMTEGKESASVSYESNASELDFMGEDTLFQRYFSLLTENYEREIKAGATLFGIHKDDLKIEINKRDARFFSSQGQGRSLALAMKMAEGEISREAKGEYPVFLLDDVLSELDEKRKAFILSKIKNRQVIITGCELADFENATDYNFIEIKDGKIAQKNEDEEKTVPLGTV